MKTPGAFEPKEAQADDTLEEILEIAKESSRDGRVRLFTCRGYDWTARYPLICEAVPRLPFHPSSLSAQSRVKGDREYYPASLGHRSLLWPGLGPRRRGALHQRGPLTHEGLMPTARYRGPPMTLANMRTNGVRSLCVTCKLCRHEAVMNVDAFDGERLEYARCRRSPLSDGGLAVSASRRAAASIVY
jgi:hypothetical protein